MKRWLATMILLILVPSLMAQDNAMQFNNQNPLQVPELRLHNGDFTSPPYTLALPAMQPTGQGATAGDTIPAPANATAGNFNYYHGFVPRPTDYNFPRQFTLNSNYAACAITSWQGGGIFATSSMNTFPGMGNIASGGVSVTQEIGRFTVTGSIIGNKYHLDNRLYNNYGVSGNISYKLSDRISLNAFGSYQHNGGLYHSMAAMPYLARSSYGATMGIDVSDKFSMEMGAQRYYDPFSHKWITRPIFIPQININGNKFGIDFGGLLYEILHTVINNHNRRQYGAPPVPGMPMAPRMMPMHR